MAAKESFWERDIEVGPWKMRRRVPNRADTGMEHPKIAWATAQRSW